jgi:hypothetical protein
MMKTTAPLARRAPWFFLCFLVVVSAFGSLGNTPCELPAQLTATPQPVLATLRPTSQPVVIVPGPTPLPAEYFRTQDQSSLITFGAVLLVLIILISALSALTASRKRKK